MENFSFSDIYSIRQAVKDMDESIKVEGDEGSVKLEKGPKRLEISKNGKVKGSMPLHSFETGSAESLEIGNGEIKVNFGEGTYVFEI